MDSGLARDDFDLLVSHFNLIDRGPDVGLSEQSARSTPALTMLPARARSPSPAISMAICSQLVPSARSPVKNSRFSPITRCSGWYLDADKPSLRKESAEQRWQRIIAMKRLGLSLKRIVELFNGQTAQST